MVFPSARRYRTTPEGTPVLSPACRGSVFNPVWRGRSVFFMCYRRRGLYERQFVIVVLPGGIIVGTDFDLI